MSGNYNRNSRGNDIANPLLDKIYGLWDSIKKAVSGTYVAADSGIPLLAVRKDTAAALAADGEYIPLIVDENGKLWVSVDSAIASGGLTTWTLDATNSRGQGKVTTGGTGTATITVSTFYTTMVATNIMEIKEFDSTGAWVATYTHSNSLITASSNVITVTGASWGASSTFVVKYDGVERTTNINNNTQQVENGNQDPWHNEWQHNVDKGSEVGSDSTYFAVIYMDTFNTLDIDVLAAGAAGNTFQLFRTLDKDAAIPADGTAIATLATTAWNEITSDVFGGAVSGASIKESEANVKGSPYMYLLARTTVTSTSFDVWTRKYFV